MTLLDRVVSDGAPPTLRSEGILSRSQLRPREPGPLASLESALRRPPPCTNIR
jgi:hypothetical protein